MIQRRVKFKDFYGHSTVGVIVDKVSAIVHRNTDYPSGTGGTVSCTGTFVVDHYLIEDGNQLYCIPCTEVKI